MSKSQQVLLTVLILALGIALITLITTRGKNRDLVTARTYQIGEELISKTNSTYLAGLRPGLGEQLASLLSSPTRISAVLLGDESPPKGDGSACSRLILTNQLRRGVEMRLAPSPQPDKFQIIGYWLVNDHPQ